MPLRSPALLQRLVDEIKNIVDEIRNNVATLLGKSDEIATNIADMNTKVGEINNKTTTITNTIGSINIKVDQIRRLTDTISDNVVSIVGVLNGIKLNFDRVLPTIGRFIVVREETIQLSNPDQLAVAGAMMYAIKPLNGVQEVRFVDENGPVVYAGGTCVFPSDHCWLDQVGNMLIVAGVSPIYVVPVAGVTLTIRVFKNP